MAFGRCVVTNLGNPGEPCSSAIFLIGLVVHINETDVELDASQYTCSAYEGGVVRSTFLTVFPGQLIKILMG